MFTVKLCDVLRAKNLLVDTADYVIDCVISKCFDTHVILMSTDIKSEFLSDQIESEYWVGFSHKFMSQKTLKVL